MSKTNRICYTCNKDYYFCPTCPSEKKKETFYNMFCCERCSKIFKTLTDETFKRLTIAQCREQLLELNVSTNENFKDGIKKHITRVFDYKEPIVEIVDAIKEKEEIIPEVEVLEEISIPELAVEEPVKKMEYVPKKNRKKKNSEVD